MIYLVPPRLWSNLSKHTIHLSRQTEIQQIPNNPYKINTISLNQLNESNITRIFKKKNNENSKGGGATINQPILKISQYRISSNSIQPSTDIKFLYDFTKQINQKSTRSTTKLKEARPSRRSHCQFNSSLSFNISNPT